ncbi:hypothetical protein ACFQV2_27295 [Actinokineospora soli]|uniref:Uncharacterized protein n=1 Tax=Actinokineospora soli TaxID=1048753 RepID=A0ABW2TS99_9PSEU
MSRLPLATAPTHLTAHLLAEIAADERTRRPYAQLVKLAALQIGFALGHLSRDGRPRVRQAEAALTLLEGARQLASAAPGLVEPFHVVQTCENLPEFDTGWDYPAHLPPTQVLDAPWTPPRRPTSSPACPSTSPPTAWSRCSARTGSPASSRPCAKRAR